MSSNWENYRHDWNQHAKATGFPLAITGMQPPEYMAYYEPIITRLAPKRVKRIYDIGCGMGMLVPTLQKLYPDAKYFGFDISDEMIAYCKQAYPDLDWTLMSAFELPGTADFIVLHSVLTHVYEPDARAYLAVIHDALASKSRASISIHTDCSRGFTGNPSKIDYEPAYFERMLQECGLRVVDYVDALQRYYAVVRDTQFDKDRAKLDKILDEANGGSEYRHETR